MIEVTAARMKSDPTATAVFLCVLMPTTLRSAGLENLPVRSERASTPGWRPAMVRGSAEDGEPGVPGDLRQLLRRQRWSRRHRGRGVHRGHVARGHHDAGVPGPEHDVPDVRRDV